MERPVAGNTFDKYGSENAVHRRLMDRFLADARALLAETRPRNVLEVGCASGELAARLFLDGGAAYVGIDISDDEIARARAAYPQLSFETASAYALPFDDASHDLVVACEVVEHLEDPERGMRELARVCRGHLLLSVPWEPVWRMANLARGAYLSSLGNTPGHLQHFSRRRIRGLVARHFDLVAERRPFPWTMLLARSRRAA